MKKILLLSLVLLALLCSCTKNEQPVNDNIIKPDFTKEELDKEFGTEELFIVKTYRETPSENFEEYLDDNLIFTKVTHYQLSDGSWKTDSHSYKYKLSLKGRMNNAAKDSTFLILSNDPDITFDMAWKAAGYSSNSEDYFKIEDAIIVGIG